MSRGVDLEKEEFKTLHNPDTFNNHSLHRVGYRKVNDHWTLRGTAGSRAREDEVGPSEPAILIEPTTEPEIARSTEAALKQHQTGPSFQMPCLEYIRLDEGQL